MASLDEAADQARAVERRRQEQEAARAAEWGALCDGALEIARELARDFLGRVRAAGVKGHAMEVEVDGPFEVKVHGRLFTRTEMRHGRHTELREVYFVRCPNRSSFIVSTSGDLFVLIWDMDRWKDPVVPLSNGHQVLAAIGLRDSDRDSVETTLTRLFGGALAEYVP